MTKKRKIRREDTRFLSIYEKIMRAYDNATGIRLDRAEVEELGLNVSIGDLASNDKLDREWVKVYGKEK